MDALLIIDAAPDQFPQSPPRSLVDLVDRARGVGGVIVHVAAAARGEDAAYASRNGTAPSGGTTASGTGNEGSDGSSSDGSQGADDDAEAAPPQIDSALGTREDELVLVSTVPDAFEGVEDLAEGLDDLGVDRIILAGSNVRGGLEQSAYAALAIGFELVVVRDGLADGDDAWLADAEAAGAVVKAGGDVWLKM